MPRLEDGISIDSGRIPEAYSMFKESCGSTGVTVQRAVVSAVRNEVGSTSDYVQSVKFRAQSENIALKSVGDIERTGTEIVLARGVRNLYSVNFNLSPDDMILFDGVAYKGNETIQIPISALSRSTLSFKYYNKDYLTSLSVMTAGISDICVYLDANGNGKLDGHFDEDLKVFVVDEAQDRKIGYFKPGTYEESMFAPAPVFDSSGKIVGYQEHFVGIEYTMVPRCLVVPSDGSEADRAQVLTALTTGAADSQSLSKEQRDYRYVKSGELTFKQGNGSNETVYVEPYSADNHLMYGAEAEALSMVSFSAGGDHNPPKRSTDPQAPYYSWDPDFRGNLMYDFENPEPVTIPQHVSGSNVQIAKMLSALTTENGTEYTYEDGGLVRLNEYLGSLTGLDTFAVAVQQQPVDTAGALMDTAALMAAKKIPAPESFERAGINLFPNGDYLSQMKPGDASPDADGGSNDKGDYGEFGIDSGVKLPTIEIGLSDYLTIIMDGTDIGFAIGIPLGGFERKTQSGFTEDEISNPKTANEENVEKFRNFFTGKWGSLLSDDSLKAAQQEKANPTGQEKDGQKQIDPGEMSSSSVSVNFSMALGFTFSYSQITNKFYFSKFAISVAAALEYRYQYRFTPVPVVYVYIKAGVTLELSTGLKVVHSVVESKAGKLDLNDFTTDPGTRPKGNWRKSTSAEIAGTMGKTLEFDALSKIYNVYFDGKILVEIWDEKANNGAGGWGSGGFINSKDTGTPVMIQLANQSGYTLPVQLPVRFTSAQENTRITAIIPIAKAQSDTYWNGMRIAPSAFVEVGAGVGVELLKFELFAKLALSMAMSFGEYDEAEGKYQPFTFDEFQMTLGIGFRVVLLFFNIEKEAIQYILNYEHGREGGGQTPWMHGYSSLGVFGQMYPLEDGDSTPVAIGLPKSNYATQRVYGPVAEGDLEPLAYDSTGAPFQISGYNSSGDAFTLADGLSTGYSYQVVTAGGENYLFYMVSRPDHEIFSTIDSSMLVMSKIKVTDTGGANYGLVHPETEEAGGFIPVDVDSSGYDDGTGDLEFKAWVDDTGKIRIIWTGYASQTSEPSEPDRGVHPVPVGTDGTTEMDSENYSNSSLFPAPSEPALVSEPPAPWDEPAKVTQPPDDEITEEPRQEDYYTGEGEAQEPVDPYEDLAQAQAAYQADLAQYLEQHEAWEAYRAYLDALAAWEENMEAWDLYNEYLVDKAAYDAAYDAYTAWKDYFQLLNDYVRTLMAVSAKNTVVKTSFFDSNQPGSGFSPATVVGGDPYLGGTTGHVFLPEGTGDGSVLFYASTVHFEDGGDAENAKYEAYVRGLYGGDDSASYKNVGAFLVEYQKSQNTLYGQNSNINIVAEDEGGNSVTTTVSLTNEVAPRKIENVELTEAGGVIYLAYTTVEHEYVTDSPVGDGQPHDIRYTRRLFLRTVSVDQSTGAATFGAPYLLRTLVNFDRSNDEDGIYSNSTKVEAYQDPYFANLQFLTAALGDLDGVIEDFEPLDSANETFLLFEMNGNTYVIPQTDLYTITAGDGASRHYGRIIPFFTKETYQSKYKDIEGNYLDETASTTGYTDVTIGADSDGNIAAVYTAMVPGSTNNAIYITKYYTYQEEAEGGPVTRAGWSQGQILAMKDMQVYEDSVTYGWDSAATEAAYLSGITGDAATTEASQFRFGNLQFALGAGGDALVLTEGTETKLMNKVYSHIETGEQMTSVVPAGPSDVGFYAVAFGQGQQAIGNCNVKLTEGAFKAGKYLKTSVSFDNVGDTRIRGSEAQPITVELIHRHEGGEDVVAAWQVVQSIVPGQKVSLTGLAQMSRDAQDGDYFYFTISEDYEYAGLGSLGTGGLESDGNVSAGTASATGLLGSPPGGAFFAQSTVTNDTTSPNYPIGRFSVVDMPDLGFEYMDIQSVGVTAAGNTELTADFYVSNRGTAKAYDVFAQFSYQTGVDAKGDPIFAALDLTGSSFEIFNQSLIPDFGTLGTTDLQNGVLRLVSTEDPSDGDDIDVGFGRQVSGTFYASPDMYYLDPATGAKLLKVRVEVFSGGDFVSLNLMDGLYTASSPTGHSEYYSLDNEDESKMGHKTYFSSARQIAIPMGNTLLLPISITTTRAEAPVILVTEHRNHDIQGDIPNSLGVLYYDSDIRCVVIVPSREGNGVIRVSDTMTGYSTDIAFTVTEAGLGINIYNDNDMFTFFNKDGSQYDPDKTGNDWEFIQAPEWGLNGDAPYLTNLAKGKNGAYFSFDTVASEIDVYFGGEIAVDSDYPGFSRISNLTSTGGNDPADSRKARFGDNKDFFAHTVTITVTSFGPTMLDKYVETYATPEPPKPAEDAVSPQIYWSRSFPDIASIETGAETVQITCYAIDDSGLASLTLNGDAPVLTKSDDGRLWQFTWTVSENGAHSVQARDIAGNTTTITVNVGWFNVQTSPGAIATAPGISAGFVIYPQGSGDGVVWDGGVVSKNSRIQLEYTADPQDAEVRIERFIYTYDESDPTKIVSAGFTETSPAITQNGTYRVIAELPDGTWSVQILKMTGIDVSLPVASLGQAFVTLEGAEVPALAYSVTKEQVSAAGLASASINGAALPGVSGRRIAGTWLPPGGSLYNGEYQLVAVDEGGNAGYASAVVSDIKVDGEGAVSVSGAYSQDLDNGVIAIDPSRVTGGEYVVVSPQTSYYGSYEYAMVPSADAFVRQDTGDMSHEELGAYNEDMANYFASLGWTDLGYGAGSPSPASWVELSGLVPEDYTVYIRDGENPDALSLIYEEQVTVAAEAITFDMSVNLSSRYSAVDGSVVVLASGGKDGNGTYQFAILPVPNVKGTGTGNGPDENLAPVDSPDFIWVNADNPAVSQNIATLNGLKTGTYQIAVRGMYGVTPEELTYICGLHESIENFRKEYEAAMALAEGLENAKSVYDAAQAAFEADTSGDPEGTLAAARDSAESSLVELIRRALTSDEMIKVTVADYPYAESAVENLMAQSQDAITASEAELNTLTEAAQAAVETAYAGDATLWESACTKSVHVGYRPETSTDPILSLRYDQAGRAVFTLTGTPPAIADSQQPIIVRENETRDVILVGTGLTVIIPAGTLVYGRDLNDLIPDLGCLQEVQSGVLDGDILALVYVDAEGQEHLVPWSRITGAGATFIASVMGKYKIVNNGKSFTDVAKHWAENYIRFIAARELFLGTGEGMFSPDIPMTRAMFVTVLGRLAGISEALFPGQAYDDVPSGTWYSAFVRWASESGVVEGYGDGRFGPDDPITREQMCAMLVRYLTNSEFSLPLNQETQFDDAADISKWAEEAVAFCQRAGLVEGMGQNRFNPADLAARAQVAAIYKRLILAVLAGFGS